MDQSRISVTGVDAFQSFVMATIDPQGKPNKPCLGRTLHWAIIYYCPQKVLHLSSYYLLFPREPLIRVSGTRQRNTEGAPSDPKYYHFKWVSFQMCNIYYVF